MNNKFQDTITKFINRLYFLYFATGLFIFAKAYQGFNPVTFSEHFIEFIEFLICMTLWLPIKIAEIFF